MEKSYIGGTVDTEAHYKLYADFFTSPRTPVLFKGQLYFSFEVITYFKAKTCLSALPSLFSTGRAILAAKYL